MERPEIWRKGGVGSAREYTNELLGLLEAYLIDNFDFGNNIKSLFTENEYFCNNIQRSLLPGNLKIIREIEGGKTGKVWIIEDETNKYVLKQIQSKAPDFLDIKIISLTNDLKLVSPGVRENICLVGGKESYLRSSNTNFMNQTIISLALQTILESNTYALQFDAFYCGRHGYTFLDFANQGTLYDYLFKVKMNDKNIFAILYQCFKPFAALKKSQHSFNHNDFKCKNVLVHKIEGKPHFLISDFDKSSMFYNNCYFYPYSTLGQSSIFQPTIEKDERGNHVMVYDLYTSFKIPGIASLQAWTMYSGYPFYLTLDFYTFLFTFLAHPKVYKYFISNKNSRLWEMVNFMWIRKEDRDKFLTKIENVSESDGQRLSVVLIHFASNHYRFRYNSRPLLDFFDISFRETKDPELYANEYHLTRGGHLCIGECDVSPCETNAYAIGGYLSEYRVKTTDDC